MSRPSHWPFDALTYFGEDPIHRVAYLTLFPLASGGRANLFVYRALNDPWLKRCATTPPQRSPKACRSLRSSPARCASKAR